MSTAVYRLRKINLDEVWQKEQGWNEDKKSGRKYDDQVELEFWRKIAPHYSEQFNLMRDVPGLKEKVTNFIGDGSRIIDVGCGTGNFTIPLASKCNEILALDFSPAMLKELSISISKQKMMNIRTVCAKWEEFSEPYDADYVLAVNSLYRICNMRDSLKRIALYGKKGFLIIRTLYRPIMHDMYEDLNLDYKRNNDYMLIPLMLWDMGIQADVEFLYYNRQKFYKNWEQAETDMIHDLGELSYMNYNNQLKEKFFHHVEKSDSGYVYASSRAVEVISFHNP